MGGEKMASTQDASQSRTFRRKLAILEYTYPAWRIRSRHGMWTAIRSTTPAQAAAGLHQVVVQPTLDALAAILAQQLDIAQRVRA